MGDFFRVVELARGGTVTSGAAASSCEPLPYPNWHANGSRSGFPWTLATAPVQFSYPTSIQISIQTGNIIFKCTVDPVYSGETVSIQYTEETEYTVQYTVLYTVEKEYTTSELVEQPAGPGSQGVASLNCDCSEDYWTRHCCIVQFTTVQCSAVWIMAMDRAVAPLQANPASIYIGPLHTVNCTL